MNFLELVKEERLTVAEDPTPACPKCGSAELTQGDRRSTLLGWSSGVDPNHVWTHYTCRSCALSFIRETKGMRVWYTADECKVLRGLPACFESYEMTCRGCGGVVSRRFTLPDGVTPARSLSTRYEAGKPVREYRIFFRCGGCGLEVETNFDYPGD